MTVLAICRLLVPACFSMRYAEMVGDLPASLAVRSNLTIIGHSSRASSRTNVALPAQAVHGDRVSREQLREPIFADGHRMM